MVMSRPSIHVEVSVHISAMVKGKFDDHEGGRINERNRVNKYVTLSS
jgi:hypothetical protein